MSEAQPTALEKHWGSARRKASGVRWQRRPGGVGDTALSGVVGCVERQTHGGRLACGGGRFMAGLSAPARAVWRCPSHRTPGVPRPALTNGSSLVHLLAERTEDHVSPLLGQPLQGSIPVCLAYRGFPRASVTPRLFMENPSRVRVRELWAGHGPMPRLLARSDAAAPPLLDFKAAAPRSFHDAAGEPERSGDRQPQAARRASIARQPTLPACHGDARWASATNGGGPGVGGYAASGFDAGKRTGAQRR